MPLWHALAAVGIKLVLARQELGAAYAADGHARVSGGLGVVVVNSGPGATNLLTGAAVASADGVPLLLITPDRRREVAVASCAICCAACAVALGRTPVARTST